jgi:diacylglycerol O-acyltransferase
MGLFPPFLAKPLSRMYAANKLTRFLPAGTPCVVTNVPGPPMELYSDAAKLVRMHCLGLLTPGVGLFNAIFSHGDKLTISILGDRD